MLINFFAKHADHLVMTLSGDILPDSTLQSSPEQISFGDVKQGDVGSSSITIFRANGDPLTITEVLPRLENLRVTGIESLSSQKTRVSLSVSTQGLPCGVFESTLAIRNKEDANTLVVPIKGDVKPRLDGVRTSLFFGTLRPGGHVMLPRETERSSIEPETLQAEIELIDGQGLTAEMQRPNGGDNGLSVSVACTNVSTNAPRVVHAQLRLRLRSGEVMNVPLTGVILPE